jgi:Class III cytochrome C family
MMKIKQCILIVAVIFFVTAFFGYSGDDTPEAEDYVRIDNSIFDNPQRPGSIFDHDVHNETAELEDNCARCHHVYKGNKLVEDESSEDTHCSECHALEPTEENTIALRAAYHKQCKDCHFAAEKGPVLCGECHVKE